MTVPAPEPERGRSLAARHENRYFGTLDIKSLPSTEMNPCVW